MKNFTQDQISAAFDNAPPAIRQAFASDENAAFLAGFGEKYRLHIDVADEVGRLVVYLLLGLINPSEFLEEIGKSGMDQPTASRIANDVNETIFKPLRAKMQSTAADGGVVPLPAKIESKPPTPAAPLSAILQKPQGIVYEAPRTRAPSMPPPNLPGAVPLPISLQSVQPVPTLQTPPVPEVPPSAPPSPAQRTPFTSPSIPRPPSITSAPVPSVAPVVTMPPPATVPASPPRPPLVKEYSTDPYREPFDEK